MSPPDKDAIARLEQQNAEFALVADLLLTLGRTLDPMVIRREVLNVSFVLTGAKLVRLVTTSGERWEASVLADGHEETCERMPTARAIRLVTEGKPIVVLGKTGEPGPGSYLGVPLHHQGAVIGALELENLPVADRLDDYQHTLSLVAGAASLALENARLHEDVRRANQRFQLAASAVRSAIYDWDIASGQVLWTEGITEVFGYLPEEVGPTVEWWLDRIHPNDQQRIREQVFGDIAEGRDFVTEYRVSTKEGQYLAVWNRGRVLRDAGGRMVRMVGSVEDVTEQKRAEEEQQRLVAELQEQTNELAAANQELEAFSYSVSHDLRAPLRAIHGFSRILVEEYTATLPAEAQRFLRVVSDNAQRMGELVDSLLRFARLSRQPLTREDIAPAVLVREVLTDLLLDKGERRIAVQVGELPNCLADRTLLRQVFANLLDNALKFTRTRELTQIEVGCREENGQHIYFVKDNGVGFDVRDAGQLFEAFQRLHSLEEYEGTGIGLAIVQRIVHRHGGKVWVEAAVDQGTTCYFSL